MFYFVISLTVLFIDVFLKSRALRLILPFFVSTVVGDKRSYCQYVCIDDDVVVTSTSTMECRDNLLNRDDSRNKQNLIAQICCCRIARI